MTTTTLSAPDISCGGCANAIRRALTGLTGVADVSVEVAGKTVSVQYDVPASKDAILRTLDRAGFPATDALPSGDSQEQNDDNHFTP